MLKSFCLLLLPVCLLAGCGGPSGESGLPTPPHKGNLVALPDGRGFVEILIDSGASAGDRGKTHPKTRIVAYFYQSDGTTEMSPAPSDVIFKLGTGEKSPVLNLSPLPKEPGKFASEPTTLPDAFRGELEAKVKGESIKAPFTIR
jgi:hypothetical protein